MDKEIQKPLEQEDWYHYLIEEIHATITEGVYRSRWELLEAYHKVGEAILEAEKKFEERGLYGKKITQRISLSLGVSQRTIQYAVKFARKFPDIEMVPEGKNISWHKLTSKYLIDNPTNKPPTKQIRITVKDNTLFIPSKYKGYKIAWK